MRRRGEVDERELTVVVDGVEQTKTAPRPPRWRHLVLVTLLLLAVVALLVGVPLAQSKIKVPDVEPTVVLVIDVSGSMMADDVKPDRMAAARASAREFISELPTGMRVGLVSLSSQAQVETEPTLDRDLVGRRIDSLEAEGGTAMGDALLTALGLVRPEAPPVPPEGGPPIPVDTFTRASAGGPPASILLISDGFNTVGQVQPLDAAELAARLEVPIYTVALGTADGQALLPDGRGGRRLQTVPPDPLTLQAVGEITRGRFYEAATARRLAEVYEDLRPVVSDRERRAVYWPLGLGIALLVLTGGLSLAWRRRLR